MPIRDSTILSTCIKWISNESFVLSVALMFLTLGLFIGNIPIAIGHVLLVAGVVMALVKQRSFVNELKALPASSKWLIAFALVAVISVLVNWAEIDRPLSYLKKVRYYLLYASVLLVPAALWRAFASEKIRDSLIICWLIPLIPAFVIGLIGVLRLDHPFADLPPGKVERLSGMHGEVMTFAYGLQFTVIALSVFFFAPSLWRSITRIPWKWMVPFAVIAGVAMYLTFSRGSMLGVVVGLTVFAAMKSRWLLIGVVAVGLIGGLVASMQGARYFQIDDPVRTNQWKTSALAFVEHPVFGLGFRNFEIRSVELKKSYGIEEDLVKNINGEEVAVHFKGHAHNVFLEAFASTGVFGGLCLIGFCSSWIREVWRSRYAVLFVPLVCAFIVSGLFEDTFYDSEVLNCLLLIYLFSQSLIACEAREGLEPESVKLPA